MANLTDADKVLRNDTGKDIVSKLDDIKDAIAAQGGGAHTLGLRVIRETITTNNNGTIDSNAMTGGAIPLSRYILSAYSPNGYFVKVGYYSSRYTFDIFDNTFALVRNTNVEICVIAVESLTL